MQVSSTQVDNSYVVGSTQKINSFTLSNSKEFFDILSKNLYSDPLRAVIRETICNAWDSHIKAGKTNIPIKATYDGENIVVQDFGTGIPHEDIPLVYGVFGGSTKVLDDTQTGGFGLGCKAPFAITESFTVQNIYNGIKGIYTCIRSDPDNNGLPSIRTIVKVPTDEPNGITVTISYSDNYCETRINSLIEDVIKFGGILANDNEDIELPIEEEFTIFERSANDPYLLVRYGNVTYPIDVKKILTNRDPNKFDFGDITVIFEAKPNTLSIAPSREGLVYDEKTVDTLFGFFKRLDNLVKTNRRKVLLKCIDVLNRKDLYRFLSWSRLESYIFNRQYIYFYKYYEYRQLTKEDIVTLYLMYVDKARYCSRLNIKHFFKKFPSCINKAMKAYVYEPYEHRFLGYKYLDRYQNSKDIFVDCHTRKIQQKVGSVVKMDIEAVDPNRAVDCSYGLHVASYDYLKDFGGDILALVLVRPEDIISVPESDTAKIRVCKYQILTVLDNNEGKLSNDEISFWINLPAPMPKEVVEIKGRTQNFTVTPVQQKNSEPKKKPKKEIKSGKISKEKKSSIVNNVKEIVDNLKKKDIEKLMIKLLDTGELTQNEIQQILNYKKKAKKSLNALFDTSRANYFRKYIEEIK